MADRTSDLDVLVAVTRQCDTDLDMSIVTTLSPPGPYPEKLRAKLDMAVLVVPPAVDGIEVDSYFDRFPVYLLPDTQRICCRIDVLVG